MTSYKGDGSRSSTARAELASEREPCLVRSGWQRRRPVALEPDGTYLAVGPLAASLASGDTFPVMLSSRDADDVTVDVTVRPGPS